MFSHKRVYYNLYNTEPTDQQLSDFVNMAEPIMFALAQLNADNGNKFEESITANSLFYYQHNRVANNAELFEYAKTALPIMLEYVKEANRHFEENRQSA
jgi:hypothetical protein